MFGNNITSKVKHTTVVKLTNPTGPLVCFSAMGENVSELKGFQRVLLIPPYKNHSGHLQLLLWDVLDPLAYV